MDAVKPLIFIHPLSPTLQKLKEVSEENAEADGVEIYEIDDMTEFNQLFPSVGQSVCVFSDPKKCAKALQANKKTMKSIHSKVILVSPKKIPPKTLEKFDKVGLTECIIEPVAPKTLMYKVKLQLRSIKAQSMDDEEEAEKTFSRNDANKKEDDDSYYKAKKSKKEEEDEESIDYRKKYDRRENEEDEDSKNGSYQEHQESHWKGKVQREDEDADGDSKKKDKYKEEAIDTHYKGKSKNTQLDFDEDLYEKEKKKESFDEDDELDNIKKSIALEVEQATNSFGEEYDELDEEADETQKDHKLDLDIQKEEKKNKSDPNHMESHMKGKLGKAEEEEENQAHDSERDHLTDNKMRGRSGDHFSDEDDLDGEKNEGVGLDLDEEEKGPRQGNQSESYDGKMKHDGEAIHEDGGPLIDEQERKSKNIEKYIKGSLSHRDHEDEKDDELIDNEVTLENAPTSEEEDPQIGEGAEDDADLKSKDHQLDLESDEQKRDPNHKDQDGSRGSQRNSNQPQAPEAETDKKRRADKGEDLEDPFSSSSSSSPLVEETKSTENQNDKEENRESKSQEYSSNEENQKPREPQRADNRADKIQKHYKGKGNRHQEQGWGNLHKRQDSHDDDFGGRNRTTHGDEDFGGFKKDEEAQIQSIDNTKKEGPSYSIDQDQAKNAGELHYAQDELGEQTIDYGKLKDEFDAIPYDLKEKKKIWTEYEGKDSSQRNVDITDSQSSPLSHINPSDLEKEVDEELQEEQENKEDGETVYEPYSCGLEEVIKIQFFYHKKEMPFKDFLDHLAHIVYEQHSGLVTFYSYKKATQGLELSLCPFKNILPSEMGGETHEKWEELKDIKLPFWQQMKLPAWSDSTFQDKELDFYYPYFESGEFMGFAVVYFTKGFQESKKGSLEVLLESARGFFSENYSGHSAKRHENSITQIDKNKSEEKEQRKTGGFFSKFFGKKAS